MAGLATKRVLLCSTVFRPDGSVGSGIVVISSTSINKFAGSNNSDGNPGKLVNLSILISLPFSLGTLKPISLKKFSNDAPE